MDREIIKWYNVNSAKAIRVLRQPARKVSISQVYRILRGSSKEALIALVAKTDNLTARSQIMRHLDTYSKIKLIVRGSDIKKMGLKPSPDYGKILNKLLYLKMDLGLRTKKQELIELNKLLNSKIR
jgi:tRNA nucleotidyltransferase (CCA-adding enzyme)